MGGAILINKKCNACGKSILCRTNSQRWCNNCAEIQNKLYRQEWRRRANKRRRKKVVGNFIESFKQKREKILVQGCYKCGTKKNLQTHHTKYPKEIIAVCRKHHLELHYPNSPIIALNKIQRTIRLNFKLRERKLNRNADKLCKNCNKIIPLTRGFSLKHYHQKKFCSNKCAADFQFHKSIPKTVEKENTPLIFNLTF